MLEIESIAWWPFDGLDLNAPSYQGKHVGIEIYPSAVRPLGVPQNDDNDAFHSCLYIRDLDHANALADLMRIDLPHARADQVRKEGWIIGMNHAQL